MLRDDDLARCMLFGGGATRLSGGGMYCRFPLVVCVGSEGGSRVMSSLGVMLSRPSVLEMISSRRKSVWMGHGVDSSEGGGREAPPWNLNECEYSEHGLVDGGCVFVRLLPCVGCTGRGRAVFEKSRLSLHVEDPTLMSCGGEAEYI